MAVKKYNGSKNQYKRKLNESWACYTEIGKDIEFYYYFDLRTADGIYPNFEYFYTVSKDDIIEEIMSDIGIVVDFATIYDRKYTDYTYEETEDAFNAMSAKELDNYIRKHFAEIMDKEGSQVQAIYEDDAYDSCVSAIKDTSDYFLELSESKQNKKLTEASLARGSDIVSYILNHYDLSREERHILKAAENEITKIKTKDDVDNFFYKINYYEGTPIEKYLIAYIVAYVVLGVSPFFVRVEISDIADKNWRLDTIARLYTEFNDYEYCSLAFTHLIPEDFGLDFDLYYSWYRDIDTVRAYYKLHKAKIDRILQKESWLLDEYDINDEDDFVQIIWQVNVWIYKDTIKTFPKSKFRAILVDKMLEDPTTYGIEDVISDIVEHCKIYINDLAE